jgi:hypothetical protein
MAAASEKIKPDDLDGCDKLQIPPNEYSRGSQMNCFESGIPR